jgi:hypothetical protein
MKLTVYFKFKLQTFSSIDFSNYDNSFIIIIDYLKDMRIKLESIKLICFRLTDLSSKHMSSKIESQKHDQVEMKVKKKSTER